VEPARSAAQHEDEIYGATRSNRVSAGRRAARRGTRHHLDATEPDEPHVHVRLDPADLPERHTPPGKRRSGSRSSRRHHAPAGKPLWKRARRLAAFLVLVGVVELTAAALTSHDFRVQAVEISGLDVTAPTAVRPYADELVGQNWLRANTADTLKAVRALPAVRSASVERTLQWPPQLELRVEERQPFARVGAGGDWWVVDEEGVPFRRARKADERLYAVTSTALAPQPGVALRHDSWEPVVTFARALSQDDGASGGKGRQWALRRIYFDKDGFASLRLEGGTHDELLVRLGAGRWPEKLQRAHQALEWFEQTGSRASELNHVSYNMPVWTPRIASGNGQSATHETDSGKPDSGKPDSGKPISSEPDSGKTDGADSEAESSGRDD
jgi:hypothetical protein